MPPKAKKTKKEIEEEKSNYYFYYLLNRKTWRRKENPRGAREKAPWRRGKTKEDRGRKKKDRRRKEESWGRETSCWRSCKTLSHLLIVKPKYFERDGIMRENREASIKSKKRDLDVKIQFNSIF